MNRHYRVAVDAVICVGGDQFLFVMPDLHDEADAVAIADRILTTLRAPMQVAGQTIAVTSSIGIAIYPRLGHTAEELLTRSDIAMYAAKGRGKKQYKLYAAQRQCSEPARSERAVRPA